MGKSAPKPPRVYSPGEIAGAQTTSNIDTAKATQLMNLINQFSPYGSTTYQQNGTQMVDGHEIPMYGQTTTLSPELQKLFDTQIGNSTGMAGAAGDLISKLNLGPLDYNDPNLIKMPTDIGAFNQQTIDSVYGQAKSRLDPQWDTANEKLANQLATQGIAPGSVAFSQANTDFARNKNDAYNSALNSAVQAGFADSSQLFNQSLAGRQQGISEMMQGQSFPLAMLGQLMGTMPGMPTQPITQPGSVPVSPTNVTGAYQIANDEAQQAYQAQMAQNSAQMGGISGLASMLAMMAMMG